MSVLAVAPALAPAATLEARPVRARLLLLLRVVLSTSFLGAALWLSAGRYDWQLLAHLSVAHVLACLGLSLLVVWLLAWRWHAVLSALSQDGDTAPSIRALMRITWVGLAINQVLPSVVAGDAVRIAQLASSKVSLAKAAGSVVVDRLYGLIGLALLALSGVHLLAPNASTLVFLVAAGLVCVGAGYQLLNRLPQLSGLRGLLLAHRLSWTTSAMMIAAAMVSHLANIAIFLVIAYALDVSLPIFPAMGVMAAILLASVLPFSVAGWGIRELALVQAFGYMNSNGENIILASIIYGLVLLIIQASGFLFLIGRNRP
jgi:glycosyltransferase 2 family protein